MYKLTCEYYQKVRMEQIRKTLVERPNAHERKDEDKSTDSTVSNHCVQFDYIFVLDLLESFEITNCNKLGAILNQPETRIKRLSPIKLKTVITSRSPFLLYLSLMVWLMRCLYWYSTSCTDFLNLRTTSFSMVLEV